MKMLSYTVGPHEQLKYTFLGAYILLNQRFDSSENLKINEKGFSLVQTWRSMYS